MLTPHFTSAIAAFGIVFTTYSMIVGSELWFVYRCYFVETVHPCGKRPAAHSGKASAAPSIRSSPWGPGI